MADTTTANASSASSSQPFNGLIQLAGIGEQAFATYTAGQAANKAVNKLNSSALMYVILGLGALGVVALVVLKR